MDQSSQSWTWQDENPADGKDDWCDNNWKSTQTRDEKTWAQVSVEGHRKQINERKWGEVAGTMVGLALESADVRRCLQGREGGER